MKQSERLPGQLLPPPTEPMRVARVVARAYPRPLCWWRGAYYEHLGTHWSEVRDDSIRKWIYRVTEAALYAGKDAKGEETQRPWAPNRSKVGDVHEAMSRGAIQYEGEEAAVMATASGVLVPETREELPHDPERFNLSALPFAYDPDAPCPNWQAFLDSSLPGDREAHEFLAEWFGYVLSGRTDRHKIAVLIGPPRCGKGILSRTLKAMVGADGWAAPTLARLGGNFGMESLIGKSLAVMGDVRWTSKHVIEAVPVMLGISGEDGFSVPRKNREDWIGKLGTRLMLMSNDAPAFNDASGALAGRMVYASFQRSFLGHEDLELESRLMQELPGILNWALDGLDRLNKRGYFTQSSNSLELRAEVDRDSAPIAAWVDDRCVLDPTAEFSLNALLDSYKTWLAEEHLAFAPSLNRMSRELRSAFGDKGVTIERKSNGAGGKHRVVTGVRPIIGGTFADNSLFDS